MVSAVCAVSSTSMLSVASSRPFSSSLIGQTRLRLMLSTTKEERRMSRSAPLGGCLRARAVMSHIILGARAAMADMSRLASCCSPGTLVEQDR